MTTPVIVALITGAFGIVIALIQSARRENKTDHALVANSLKQIHKDIHRVGEKVDRHIEWHAEGGSSGRVSRSDQQ
jgi:uncharacterized protein (UPF0210 family)